VLSLYMSMEATGSQAVMCNGVETTFLNKFYSGGNTIPALSSKALLGRSLKTENTTVQYFGIASVL